MGRVFVRRAREEGACVFFTYYSNQTEAEKLIKSGAQGFRVDLTKRVEIDQLKKEIQSQARQLDAIVFNAAIVKDHTLQNLTEAQWDEVISADLSSVYYLTKEFLPLLSSPHVLGGDLDPRQKPACRTGRHPGMAEDFELMAAKQTDLGMTKCPAQRKIINIISRVGLRGGFGQANYAAAKGGLIALTKSLALELGKKQILVNAVNPGFMKSKMTEAIPEEIFDQNKQESLLGIISNPEAVADFLIYLLSDRFQNVTGQIFHLDSRKI